MTFIIFMKKNVTLKLVGTLFKRETSSQSVHVSWWVLQLYLGKLKCFQVIFFHVWLEAFKKSFDSVNIPSIHQVLFTNTGYHLVNFKLLLGKFSLSLMRSAMFPKVFLAMQYLPF